MRLLFLALVVSGSMACTSTVVTETDIPVTSRASTGCIKFQEWAFSANRGADVYGENCAYCHNANGSGQGGDVPSLASNAALAADPARGIRMILVTKNPATSSHGMTYEEMTAIFDELSHRNIADVMTYVLSSWNNCAGPVYEAQVGTVAASM